MKKLFVLTLVLALILAIRTPVPARGGGGIASQLYGTFSASDANALCLTVLVESPDRYDGVTTVQVTSTTVLKYCDGDSSIRISFADLEKGQPVRVTGAFVGGVFVATKIISY